MHGLVLFILIKWFRYLCLRASAHVCVHVVVVQWRAGKIMETLDIVGLKLFVLAALKEHKLYVSVILLFVYAVWCLCQCIADCVSNSSFESTTK
jgi:hypothetical protein